MYGRDALGLSNTDRDHSGMSVKNAEKTMEITSVDDDLRVPLGQEDAMRPDDSRWRYAEDLCEDDVRDELALRGYPQQFREAYLSRYRSDSGEVALQADSRKGVLSKIFMMILFFFGVAAIAFAAYTFFASSNQEAWSAPVPDDADLFSEDDEMTYDGPAWENVDWEAEFDKIEYSVAGNTAGVVVPSLDIHSELIQTDTFDGALVLPDPPLSTWYERTVPFGAEEGNSVVASHVNAGFQEMAPFSHLFEAERGTLAGVRNADGDIYIYEVTEMNVYNRQAVPVEYFRTDDDHRLHLVTCSGEVIDDPMDDENQVFEHNLIVSAELVHEM